MENSNSKLLAHWRFNREQWREFLYFEKVEFEHRTFVDLRKILTRGVVILFLIAIFGAAKGGLAVFIFVLLAGNLFLGFCYLIH